LRDEIEALKSALATSRAETRAANLRFEADVARDALRANRRALDDARRDSI